MIPKLIFYDTKQKFYIKNSFKNDQNLNKTGIISLVVWFVAEWTSVKFNKWAVFCNLLNMISNKFFDDFKIKYVWTVYR